MRLVDDCCADGAWDLLEGLATRGRLAVERGHQLWPAADHAEHRLALEAPGGFAARAVARDATRFGPAPLTEVAASSHQWGELAPHLPDGPLGATVAHERVVRGEDLTGEAVADDPLGLPLRLVPWEPTYRIPEVGPYGVDDPVPLPGRLDPVELPGPGEPAGGVAGEGADALRELAKTWVEESNGHARSAAVWGGPESAVAALEDGGRAWWRPLGADEALSLMAWAGSSGGAHGRRRGAARGRFEAWWCAAGLTGLLDDRGQAWPPGPDELGEAAGGLGWWLWASEPAPTGWHLNLAVHDPVAGLSWALSAGDRKAGD